MNEAIKKILVANAGIFFIAFCSVIFFIFGYLLSIRADAYTALAQSRTNASSISKDETILDTLIPEIASIKQLSSDTNDKVNYLYTRLK